MRTFLQAYLSRLSKLRQNSQSTDELSLRPALDELFQALKPAQVDFVGEGKQLASGRPDFTFTRGIYNEPIGYVEAEKIAADLGKLTGQAKAQNERFCSDLDNFLLTNHLDFRLYDGGNLIERVTLPESGEDLSSKHETDFARLWERFTEAQIAAPQTPKELATLLARRARTLRIAILESLIDFDSPLRQDLAAFRKLLLPNLTQRDFANLYAETLTYGLFAARCQNPGSTRFSAQTADRALKRTPLLRTLYRLFEAEIDKNLEWVLENMAAILNGAAINEIRDYFSNRSGRPDPMIDFYEPFLAQYDPKARKSRGVYYTPEPVVSYIVRSVHTLLKDSFDMEYGVAGGAKILDPATGTGSFLFAVLDEMYREIGAKDWKSFVRDKKPLSNIFGFELMVAPYTIAHLKLALQLEGLGTALGESERLGIFLTNTLDDARRQREALLEGSIADEVNSAADVKEKTPIIVVLGNPPYSGHSSNASTKIVGNIRVSTAVGKQIQIYAKGVAGLDKPAQSKWLQDDYVKFLAFAQRRIELSGEGIVAFITNHTYLDSETFCGMRKSFLDTFSTIYLLDLHGNAKRKEKAPDGSADENVFDIQQGVAIILAVKEKGQTGEAKVLHADLLGSRKEKYSLLSTEDVTTTKWEKLAPAKPDYRFTPLNTTNLLEYQQFWSVADIFSPNGKPAPGIVTTQDKFAISFTEEEAKDKVDRFLATKNEAEARKLFRLCSQDQWNYRNAKRDLSLTNWQAEVRPIHYRPFDTRWTVYNSHVAVHRRERVMKHMILGSNMALITSKMTKGEEFAHVQVANKIVEVICMSPNTSNNGFVFPLYLYSNGLFGAEKKPNLSEKYLAELTKIIGKPPAPEAVFGYIYANLHSPAYRSRYAQFLKTDFPRVPMPTTGAHFERFSQLGLRLVALHTLDVKAAPVLREKRHALTDGSDIVEKPRFDANNRCIWINKTQAFENIEANVYAFMIGGYKVADKWLSDRKGRTLSFEERRIYPQIIIALTETLRIMDEIENLSF